MTREGSLDYVAESRQYRIEDSKSASTIVSYVGDVQGFLRYLEFKGTVFDGQLRRFYVTSYEQYLQDSGYKINAINIWI